MRRSPTAFGAARFDGRALLVASLVHLAVLALVVRSRVRIPAELAVSAAPTPRVERIRYLPLTERSRPSEVGVASAPRGVPRGPASPAGTDPAVRSPAQPAIRRTGVEGRGSGGDSAAAPTAPAVTDAILGHPFLRVPDPALLIDPRVGRDSSAREEAIVRDSILRWHDYLRSQYEWTVRLGDDRIGLTPGVLRIGPVALPIPSKVLSIRMFDPNTRAQRAMQAETREMAERIRRDSVVARPRRP